MIPESLLLGKITKQVGEIGGAVFSDHLPITDITLAETADHLSFAVGSSLTTSPITPGSRWGSPWGTGWFRLSVSIPPEWRGQQLALHFEPGGEALVYLDGKPWHGLDRRRTWCLLPADLPEGPLLLHVEALADDTSAEGEAWAPRVMRQPRISRFNEALWSLWHDLTALAELAPLLESDSVWRARLIRGLSEAVDPFDYRDLSPAAFATSIGAVRSRLAPLYACHAQASAPRACAVGNAHIDLAWRWPFSETRRKSVRTFANVLRLQERYPEFTFHQSQVFLFEAVKATQPALYAEILERCREGRILIVGSMYAEADCNLPGGESLVRQILYGNRFFKEELDQTSRIMWLPDTFGFPASLPQLIRRGGMQWFFTHKLAWNNFSKFPFHSFVWEGLDGTQILTHCTPADSYNSELDPEHLRHAQRGYREKDRSSAFMIPFGRGDGGGGPTPLMLERLRRYSNIEGLPRVTPMAPEAFFEQLESERPQLPVWRGELYLERHRGVFTSQAEMKRLNRRLECMLHDVEWLTAWRGAAPAVLVDEAWKSLLLHQFHDVLPGCAIRDVYVKAERDLSALLQRLEALRRDLVPAVAEGDGGDGVPIVVLNSLGWERREAVSLPRAAATAVCDAAGANLPAQIVDDRLHFMATVPPFGSATYYLREGAAPTAPSTPAMENAHLRVDFDEAGRLIGILHKASGRQLLAPGSIGNQFQFFIDKPVQFEAWEIEPWTLERPVTVDGELLGSEIVESGPVRTVLRQQRRLSRSRITQEIILQVDSPLIRFETSIEWGDERDLLLKVAFPLDVRSQSARYEIQFGHVHRPTHANTPADAAQFEVPAQRWADLAEPDFGVALLNDGRYGYDARDQILRLSLLRATTFPDPQADIHRTHRITYAILPHGPDLMDVVRAGYALNHPLIITGASGASSAPAPPLVTLEGDNVILETIKPAEGRDGLILRLYEARGCHATVTLRFPRPVASVHETDLLENDEQCLVTGESSLTLSFTPFTIRTLRMRA